MISLKSKPGIAVLGHFFLEDGSLYLNEMVRLFSLDKRNLLKKLKEFVRAGILKTEEKGSEIYYSLNKNYPLISEYKKIVLKTYGFENKLKEALRNTREITEAYIFGSYASDKMDASSDIDILVVGNANTITLNRNISRLQKYVNREINLTNMTKEEFEGRKRKNDPFIKDIYRNKAIKII